MNRVFLLLALLALDSPSARALPLEFKGRTVLGAPFALRASPTGKGTVILFLSAKCPCSASHEPALKALHAEFSKLGFQFVGIHSNGDETDELALAHFRASALPFPVLRDPASSWANELGAYKTPHAFVIDPRGKIVFQGGVDDSHMAPEAKRHYLKDALTALSRGNTPDPSEVRALGCIIKRKEKP